MTQHTLLAVEKPLQKIFCDDYAFSIPPYQRPYAWERDQAAELLADLTAAWADGSGNAAPYFLGSLVLIKHPQRPEADVVDGQQRLTTLTILLAVLRDLTPAAGSAHKLICQVGDVLLGTRDSYRLRLRERDATFFEEKIQHAGATAALPDWRALKDSQARIVENAGVFRDELEGWTDAKRLSFATYLVQQCYLVVVAASDQDAAFRIFSVLNSRGLDLTPADILKAEIIGAVASVSAREECNEKWEQLEAELGRARFAELFGHIRTIHRKQKMKETLVAEFRQYVPARADPVGFIEKQLLPYGDAFEQIITRRFESHKNAGEINALLEHMGRVDNFDWQPVAIEALARRRDNPDFLLRFMADLERLAYGLLLLRADTNHRLRRYGQVLEAMQGGMDLLLPDAALQLTPDEKSGILAALDGDIYGVTRIRLPLLLRLDAMLSSGGATHDPPLISVEHVLPQAVPPGSQWECDFPDAEERARWVHRLANLVLLTHRKNSQASNADFAVKKERYFRGKGGGSPFVLTSQVLAEPVWTPDTLNRRQQALIARVAEAWRLR